MDLNRLTQKSQQALAAAQDAATRAGHVEVDSLHLLLALLQQPDGLVPRLLDAMGTDVDRLTADVEAELQRIPRSTGAGGAPQGQVVVSARLAALLDEADKEARRLSDEYVSVEHLLVAMVAEAERSPAGRVLARRGIPLELDHDHAPGAAFVITLSVAERLDHPQEVALLAR